MLYGMQQQLSLPIHIYHVLMTQTAKQDTDEKQYL